MTFYAHPDGRFHRFKNKKDAPSGFVAVGETRADVDMYFRSLNGREEGPEGGQVEIDAALIELVGVKVAQDLASVGILTLEKAQATPAAELAAIDGVGPATIDKLST